MVAPGTHTLTLVGAGEDVTATGDLDVTADLEIDGAGAGATVIDGNGTDRVFDIDPIGVVGLTVLLSGMTLQNGSGVVLGGAVRSSGILTVADSVVRTSTANGSGGGIWSDGSLRVERCTVRDNAASGTGPTSGGGIDAQTLEIIDSTISDNTAFASGSSTVSEGGGIAALDLTMAGSTVSGNVADASFNRFSPNVTVGGGLLVGNATM